MAVEAEPGTVVLLVRHGETQWNREQRIQGHLDVPLTERGVEQARRLAAWLSEEPPDVILSSDLQRSRVTAETLARAWSAEGDGQVGQVGRVGQVERQPQILLDVRLREASFGEWQGLSLVEIEERWPEQFEAWRSDALRHRPPGGETIEDLQARCMASLAEELPCYPRKRIAVVSHGGPIRAMVCGLLELPLSVYPRLRVENTAVTRILFSPRGTVLAGFNDVSHLKESAAAPAHTGWEEK